MTRFLPKPHHSVFVIMLVGLLLAMTLATLIGLHMVSVKQNRLSTPGQHAEVWQSYQLHSSVRRLIASAERLLADEAPPTALIQRLGVMESMLPPLRKTEVYRFLPSPAPNIEATLASLERLAEDWSARLSWQDTTRAIPVARDILNRLPPLLEPTHQIIVTTNMAVAHYLDSQRLALKHTLQWLGGVLLLMGAGCVPLAWKLWRDHHRTQHLSAHISTLDQTLEQRVVDRTRRLNEQSALLTTILDSSPSDVALIDADSERIFYISDALRQRSPTPDTFRLRDLFVDPCQYAQFHERLVTGQPLDHWEARLGPQAPYWAQLSVRHLRFQARPAWLIWSLDITERKRMEHELKRLATTDALTGLPNRRNFLRQGLKQLRRHQREGLCCAVLAIDIDYFKHINDAYGHQVGDGILQEVANRLRRPLSQRGLIGRIGGEEFAVLLPDTCDDEAWQMAETLRQAIAAPPFPHDEGAPLTITVSIGLALQSDSLTPKQLMARADQALYRAKAKGRNRCIHLTARTPTTQLD